MLSIQQIYSQIKAQKEQLQAILSSVKLAPLANYQDIKEEAVSLDEILQQIPTQLQLQDKLNNATQNILQATLTLDTAKYQLIKKVKQRLPQIKPQAKKIYYLLSSLNLPRKSLKFQELSQKHQIKLASDNLVKEKSKLKSRGEKNSISETYLRDLKKIQKKARLKEQIAERLLNMDQCLITVGIYDNINQEKMQQVIFTKQHSLLKLKESIYCLIKRLQQSKQQNVMKQQMIENSPCFLVIEDKVYCQGTRKQQEEVQRMIFKIQSEDSCKKMMKMQMSKYKLKDIRIVIGKPYIFRHMGGCDHFIVFENVRLINNDDVFFREYYPLQIFQARKRIRKCEGCERKNAEVVYLNHELKNGKNLYICKQCGQNIHSANCQQSSLYKPIKYLHD